MSMISSTPPLSVLLRVVLTLCICVAICAETSQGLFEKCSIFYSAVFRFIRVLSQRFGVYVCARAYIHVMCMCTSLCVRVYVLRAGPVGVPCAHYSIDCHTTACIQTSYHYTARILQRQLYHQHIQQQRW